MANEKIYLGLDIGTNSVGWAVTNESYKLKKFKNNLMWGVNLFDEAQQSAERRSFRTARRRLDRRKQRVFLLQELFADEILKTDPKFFMRLKESALLPEDSEHREHNIFFDDKNYGDKEYFKEYPTIHHLICELMSNDAPHDIRMVYYACAYILAHRGHFLFSVSKDNIDKITEFKDIYDDFYTALSELCDIPVFDKNAAGMSEILKKHISVKEKTKEIEQLLFGKKAPKADDGDVIAYDKLVSFISGGTVKLSDMFCKEEYKDLEKNSICVKNADLSDTLEMLTGQIDELHLELLVKVKAMYDWSLLVDILNGHKMISKSKVEIFDKHKKDLSDLKYFVRTYLDKKSYDEIFRVISDKANYVSYVYNAPSDSGREKYKRCSQEDFCKFLKPFIEKMQPKEKDQAWYGALLEKCINNDLCPKQVTTDNRVIPYQLYYAELKKILENASKYLPFLNERDSYGTVADKILSIMEFRVPYYVGPLVDAKKSRFAWMIRKNEGKIYPWNFSEMIDEEASENEFIRNMTCKCTYMAGEDVLPKYSLLYSKFNVLNEINNIKVNGEPISVEIKQRLYQDKFVSSRAKVTKKRIAEYFMSIGEFSDKIEITGIDDNVKSSLSSYHDFKRMLEQRILSENDAESIIERITVTNDKKRLKKWLKDNFIKLSYDDISYLSKLKYKDYGRLSRKFLEELHDVDPDSGEVLSESNIMSRLWETNDNLMKLLSSKYKYSDSLEAYNRFYYDQPQNKMSLDERLKDMYLAPAVRRSVIRTLDIVKELKSILKRSPDKVFIEMARGEGETPKGKRTISRKEQLSAFLADIDAEDRDVLKKRLDDCDDGKLRSEKYYLYFMQLGKCAYTGKTISFEELEDNHKWNIDHIWPQAKIKDDSLENKVLVDSNANGLKGDKYPIDPEIRKKMSPFWKSLHEKKMMGDKKYNRLMRTTAFTEDELSGFIARQLVETRQSTKAVATVLKELLPETDIVYVKAGLVSEFRQEMDMLKCREVNDLHHAKDAYLNIVMGNIYNTRFTKDPLNFVRKERNYSIKLTTLISKKIERNGEVAWDPSTYFETVRKMMSKNSIRYVRYTYKRKGGLFNQLPERRKEGLVPRKHELAAMKYGGYNNTTASFFSLIKVKDDIVFIPINLMDSRNFQLFDKNSVNIAFSAIKEFYPERKLKNISESDISFPLNHRIIKINTLIEIDGFRVNLCSKDSKGKYISVSSAVSFVVDKEQYDYIKKIESFKKKHDENKKLEVSPYIGITEKSNIELYDLITEKCGKAPFSRWNKFKEAGKILKDGKERFNKENITDQALDLLKAVNILKTGRTGNCDLQFAGGVANFNTVRFNSVLDSKKFKEIYIIDQSPTGLFEKRSENLLEL